MTKREKIIQFLEENNIDIFRFTFIEEKRRYQRPGTIVIHQNYLTDEEQHTLFDLSHRTYDPTCPVEIHGIRDRFEWQWNLTRIVWKKGA